MLVNVGYLPFGIFLADKSYFKVLPYPVRVCADAAGALGEVLGVARIAALQDDFKATVKCATATGVLDFAAFNFNFNTQMPFDAGQRVHHNGPGVAALGRLFDLAHDSP